MYKFLIPILFSCLSATQVAGQKTIIPKKETPRVLEFQNIDSLKQLLNNTPADTNKVKLLLRMSRSYYFNRPDTCLLYSNMAMDLARSLNFKAGLIESLRTSGEMFRILGDFPASLKCQFEALELSEKTNDQVDAALCLNFIGVTYLDFTEYRTGLHYLFKSAKIPEQPSYMKIFNLSNTGYAYDKLGLADSGLYYHKQAYASLADVPVAALRSLILIRAGDTYKKMGLYDSALIYLRQGLMNSFPSDDRINVSSLQKKIAEVYLAMNQTDSAFYYAYSALATAQTTGQKPEIMEAAYLLHHLYRKTGNSDSAFVYADLAGEMKDKVFGAERFKQLQLLMMSEQERQQNILRDQEKYKNRIRYTALLSALAVLFFIGLLLFRNNRQKQKAKQNIERAYTELKNTQIQLVQKEKMASLGELTAGIAHEIQNPLNFVNNFSEVNSELLAELKEELATGKLAQADSIVNDIIENEKKIIHHGRRAGTIVNGMLQHSRSSSGTKEETDINQLASEYLKLAQHSFKAKQSAFTAPIRTDYDPSAGNLQVLPQDLGRVIFNLVTNAFYAVSDRQKKNEPGYEPLIELSTKKYADKVEIKVKDNGSGMTDDVLAKIFQPFFTTRTTGEGTGLGLSISYDIVTKGHDGELKVKTEVNQGSEFIMELPLKA